MPWGGTTPRLLRRLTSPHPRAVGRETWPSGVRVSPARPAAVCLLSPCHSSAQHTSTRVHQSLSCVLLQRVHPSRPQRLRSASELLFIALPLQLSSRLPQSSPAAAPAAPSPGSRPGGAGLRPACGRQRWPAAGAGRAGRPQARASAGAGWQGVGGRGRWKRPFDFPILLSMRLTPEDQTWLEAYRRALAQQFPALVQHLILFGSKARGTVTAESDLDLLVVIQQGDWRLKDAVTEAGYLLAIGTDVVPSIIVLTVEEWGRLQKREAPFWQTVTRDGVAVQ
jgi:uncharacterized protein